MSGEWNLENFHPNPPLDQNILTLLLKSTDLTAAYHFLIRAQPPPGV